eukprot:evm.model.scf_2457.1 EVM.evm.TU.scf_2457.1   scf_2457:378-12449(+)
MAAGMLRAASLAAIIAVLALGADGDALDDQIKASEDLVRGLQAEATELYRTRKKVVPGCACSVHSCSNQFRESLVCTERMGKLDRCRDCQQEGLRLDLEEPLVRTPPGSDPDDLTPDVLESLCTFKPLDESLVAAGKGGNFMWTYIGTTTGTMRIWPGLPRERGLVTGPNDELLGNCRQYDPRTRPWFIAASSGPKDVVVLLDTSGSMVQEIGDEGLTRWDVTRDAVSRLLESFSISDFVSIVTFNSDAAVLGGSTTLTQVNDMNIAMLQEALTTVEPDGGTDFGVGFEMAFNILISSAKESLETEVVSTSACTKIILFLTDGEDCTVNAQQPCKFGESEGSRVIWSDIYEDDGGSGKITTAAMPVYSPDLKDIPGQLIGVVGHDVRLSDLMGDGEDDEDVISRLIDRASVCRMTELSPCQLQVLRGAKAECPNVFNESACYQLGSKYYATDLARKLPFEDAEAVCIDAGGQLAEIATTEEHWMLSSLAAREGSWIGLRLDTSADPLTWRWIRSGTGVEDPFSVVSGEEEGTGDDVVKVGGRRGATPTVPRIDDCGDFESALAASTKLVKATANIDSGTAICPLGLEEERSTEDVQCCCSEVGCVDEKDGLPCLDILVTNNG